jgi:choline dehydrogenase-like flavoprotein
MILPRVNAVVIGAGAGGGIVAKELATAGLQVVLLERGRWYTAADCRKDDLRNQRTTILGNAFGPDDERHPRVVVDASGRERVVTASEGGYSNNAACVGGGTLSYGAMAWRFLPQDFRMRSTYGAPAGSTLEDWPLDYNELEPFYTKAEWEIGVSGDNTRNPFAPRQSKPLPMPPLTPETREHRILEAAAHKRGLHPFPIPMLRNSVSRDGRGACMRCRWCVGFACEVDAKCGTQNTVIPKALKTGHCELRTQSVVSEITVGSGGRASGVVYFDQNDRRQEQPADLIVVAGCAIETARLLLNSRSRLFPNGLGNRHDWVGRNLQGHTYTGALGLFPFDTYDDIGPGASIAVCDYNHGNPGLCGGAMLANEFIRLPIHFVGLRPPKAARWGKPHKDFMRQWYRRTIAVQGPTQEIPVWDARVQVDLRTRDYWGTPVARLSGGKHAHTIETGNWMCGRAEEWLKAAGAIETWHKKTGPGLSGGQHQAGTCRMSSDPAHGVCNKYGQLWETPNVFLADGSVHVTNGGFNPVLTIMALAYHVSDYIGREWKGTGLRG